MAAKTTVDIFDTSKKPIQIIFALAWPIFLENVLSTLVHYADTAMVGQLGAYATASTTLCNQAMFLITGAVLAMGTGITALVARAIGADDIPLARKLTRQAVMLVLYLGLPLCIVYAILSPYLPVWLGGDAEVIEYATQYNLIIACGRPFAMLSMVLGSVFRGAGDPKTPLRLNLGVNLINVIGNYLLIYETHTISLFGLECTMWGAGWGVNGAAAATAISMAFGGILFLLITFLRPSPIQIGLNQDYRLNWPLLKRISQIGLPAMFERTSNLLAGMLITSTVAFLGTTALAANALMNTATEITMMPAFALSAAATTMVGQFLGAKMPKDAERYVYRIIGYAEVVITSISILLFLFAEQLIGLFTPDQEVIAMASKCLKIVSVFQPIQMIAFVFAGGLRGAGDARSTLYIIAFSNWVFRVTTSVIAVRFLGFKLEAIAVCMGLDMLIRSILFYLRFRTGKWKTAIRD